MPPSTETYPRPRRLACGGVPQRGLRSGPAAAIVPAMQQPSDDLALALELAALAREEILPRWRRCAVLTKADGSEVTEADRAAEQVMRARLAEARPQERIVGEEFGASEGEAEAAMREGACWVLDPIDGTAAFTLGVPTFGTLIARLEDGAPTLGVIAIPAAGELTYAERGGGCWMQRGGEPPQRVSVRPTPTLAEAVASTTGVHSTDWQHTAEQTPWRMGTLINAVRKFRFVGDCWQHAMVCQGRLQLAIDTIVAPWDIAALLCPLSEAGASVSGLDGAGHPLVHAGSLISAASPELLSEARQLLAPG